MSTTFKASIYIGFRVHSKDLWVKRSSEVSCSKGHLQKDGAKFCSECGGPHTEKSKWYPSEGFQRLLQFMGFKDLVDTERSDLDLEDWEEFVTIDGGLHFVTTLGKVDSWSPRDNKSSSEAEVQEAFALVKQWQKTLLGADDLREVRLHLASRLS